MAHMIIFQTNPNATGFPIIGNRERDFGEGCGFPSAENQNHIRSENAALTQLGNLGRLEQR